MNKTIVFDFDGVINSYKSGWEGAGVINDPPVVGIKELIADIRKNGDKVIIQSSRCDSEVGLNAIKDYLEVYNIEVDDITNQKPPAAIYVDDRAICFNGDCNNLRRQISKFRPLWDKPVFKKCTILGVDAIFTKDRIKHGQFPLLKYDIMCNPETTMPCCVCTDTNVNFCGSVLSNTQIIKTTHNSDFYVVNGAYVQDFVKPEDCVIHAELITVDDYIKEERNREIVMVYNKGV